jgi:tetratricopeptide (TPR) repeat protein
MGTTGRALLGATAATAAAAVALLGGVLAGGGATGGPGGAAGGRPTAASSQPYAAGDTAALVRRLEGEVSESGSPDAYVALGLAYQQRARETADFSYYARSERALRAALGLRPHDVLATSGLGSLALSRHEFRTALALGRRAERLGPGLARPLGVVGDALVELGRYREAFATFDRMAALKPGIASYARVAYARELLGDRAGAVEAMRLALGPAQGLPEPTAWVRVQLGKLRFGSGEIAAAGRELRLALAALPGYPYALDGLARVEAAQGRTTAAIGHARSAVDAVPLPEFVSTLADLLEVSGRGVEATRQHALVGAIERLLRANGVRTDLESALFDLDHGLRLRDALARARAGRAARPSIVGDDTLSWALARNGRCEEAVGWSRRALRLGTRDAAMFFHRGYAERCAGRPAEARRWFAKALDLNPQFSLLWAPVARRALS